MQAENVYGKAGNEQGEERGRNNVYISEQDCLSHLKEMMPYTSDAHLHKAF